MKKNAVPSAYSAPNINRPTPVFGAVDGSVINNVMPMNTAAGMYAS